MDMSYDPAVAGNGLSDGDVIDLEPTVAVDLGASVGPRPSARVGLVEGSLASLAGETHELRRRRLLEAAAFLAATFGTLLVWVFVSDNPGTLTAEGSPYSLRVGM